MGWYLQEKKLNYFFYFFLFFQIFLNFSGFGTDLKRVGSSTGFFQFFLPASVLDLSFLMGHGSDRFEH
jgi:hypothetical protein